MPEFQTDIAKPPLFGQIVGNLRAITYVENQKQYHAQNQTWPALEPLFDRAWEGKLKVDHW